MPAINLLILIFFIVFLPLSAIKAIFYIERYCVFLYMLIITYFYSIVKFKAYKISSSKKFVQIV